MGSRYGSLASPRSQPHAVQVSRPNSRLEDPIGGCLTDRAASRTGDFGAEPRQPAFGAASRSTCRTSSRRTGRHSGRVDLTLQFRIRNRRAVRGFVETVQGNITWPTGIVAALEAKRVDIELSPASAQDFSRAVQWIVGEDQLEWLTDPAKSVPTVSEGAAMMVEVSKRIALVDCSVTLEIFARLGTEPVRIDLPNSCSRPPEFSLAPEPCRPRRNRRRIRGRMRWPPRSSSPALLRKRRQPRRHHRPKRLLVAVALASRGPITSTS